MDASYHTSAPPTLHLLAQCWGGVKLLFHMLPAGVERAEMVCCSLLKHVCNLALAVQVLCNYMHPAELCVPQIDVNSLLIFHSLGPYLYNLGIGSQLGLINFYSGLYCGWKGSYCSLKKNKTNNGVFEEKEATRICGKSENVITVRYKFWVLSWSFLNI